MKTYTVYVFCKKNEAEDLNLADYSLEVFYNEKENILQFKNYRFLNFRASDENLFDIIKRTTLGIISKKHNKIKIYDVSGALVRRFI